MAATVLALGLWSPGAILERYHDLTELILRLVSGLFESYGYWVVFLGPLLENTLFLGLLVPGVLIMILAGISAQEGTISLPVALSLGIVGAVIGDLISYAVGRLGWQRVLRGSAVDRWTEQVRQPVMRYGVWFVLLYHFAGYSRMVGPAAAGFMRMPLRRWAPLDFAGVVLWVVAFMMKGYLLGWLGLSLDDNEGNVRAFEAILLAGIILWIVVLSWRARRELRARRLQRGQAESAEGGEAVAATASGHTPEVTTRQPPRRS